MAETTIYAEQDGGGLSVAGTDWSDLRSKTEAGGIQYSTATTYDAKIDATGFELYQLLFRFDTSPLEGATINSVTLQGRVTSWGSLGGTGTVEAFVLDSDVIANGFDKADLVSVAESTSLYSGGYLAATSPSIPNQSAEQEPEFVSDGDFPDLLNLSGYTPMVLLPTNWRGGTEATQRVNFYTQHHATEAYRPRLVIDYTQVSLPELTTKTVTDITSTTAKSGGIITDDGGETLLAYGVCWNTTGSPTTEDDYTDDS